VTRAHIRDEIESARILIREGLVEEAKRILYRALTAQPDQREANLLLDAIQQNELQSLLDSVVTNPEGATRAENTRRSSWRKTTERRAESQDKIIEDLERDLHFQCEDTTSNAGLPRWVVEGGTPSFDLGIAFYQMDCFADALPILEKAEKDIRAQTTALSRDGIMIASMIAHCRVQLGDAFGAKLYLEPILFEPEVALDDKTVLFYEMGRIEEALSNPEAAQGWWKRVLEIDPQFRDAAYRIRVARK